VVGDDYWVKYRKERIKNQGARIKGQESRAKSREPRVESQAEPFVYTGLITMSFRARKLVGVIWTADRLDVWGFSGKRFVAIEMRIWELRQVGVLFLDAEEGDVSCIICVLLAYQQ